MSMDDIDGMDAAAILSGLADALEMLPELPDGLGNRQRDEMIGACRSAARLVGRELQGGDGAQAVVLEAMARRGGG